MKLGKKEPFSHWDWGPIFGPKNAVGKSLILFLSNFNCNFICFVFIINSYNFVIFSSSGPSDQVSYCHFLLLSDLFNLHCT